MINIQAFFANDNLFYAVCARKRWFPMNNRTIEIFVNIIYSYQISKVIYK